MGLHRFKPPPSGRMGIFWTLSGIQDAAIVEFGCMGHNLYGRSALRRAGVFEGYGANPYTTYIDETDISLGDTSRLDAVIKHVIETENPRVIFLLPSAVPEVIGTDMEAIARELRIIFNETPIIPVGRGSFAASQHKGITDALLTLAQKIPKKSGVIDNKFNIIGSCPDLFNFGADAEEIIRIMRGAFNMEPGCVLSAGTNVSAIEKMGGARINLVIRREGVPAGEFLKNEYGTPFIYGRPYGIKGTADWLIETGNILGDHPFEKFIGDEKNLAYRQIKHAYDYLDGNAWSFPEEAALIIGGHYDVVKGILNFAVNEMPLKRGGCWCDCPEMADDTIPYFTENEWIPIVENHKKGYLMFSGEALRFAKKNTRLQISNPDIEWRIHPYDAPFTGFRGAVNLMGLWVSEYARTH